LIGTPGRLNPALDYYNPVDRDVNRLLYSSLVRFDTRGIPQSDLAESWGISQDGMTYNFSLKENAVWHDGQPVTSQDVIFTVSLLQSEQLPLPEDVRSLWREVKVTSLSDTLLQFQIPEPFAPFLDYLTFGILPAHLLGETAPEQLVNAPFNLQPIGTGPYRFEQWLVADDGTITGVVLAAFDAYYDERPFIDQFIFQYFEDAASALAAYQNGEVSGISEVTPDILDQALAEPGLSLYTGRLPQLTLVLFNLDNPRTAFLQDLEVRQALMMALNRQRMIDTLMEGQAILAEGPIFPGTWAYFDDGASMTYDRDAAINLLRAAEYTIPAEGGEIRSKEDVLLSFTLLHPDTELHAQIAQSIQESWARIGVEAILEPVPYDTLINDRLDLRNYEAALVDLSLFRSPDPDPYPFWHQAQASSGQNYARWDDRPASEYLEQARITTNLDERARLYRNFQVRFARELPALPLFYPVYTYGVDNTMQEVRMGPLFDPSDRLGSAQYWFILDDDGE
jgi:peptide/nickel transport system substrate-binding protein